MAPRLPELVRDSRLETLPNGDRTTHVYCDRPGRSAVTRLEEWKRERILGHGGGGVVWLEKQPLSGQLRAVKQIMSAQPGSMLDACKHELEALAKFSKRRYAACFVHSFGWYESPGLLSIALEYCPDGDLQRYLAQHGKLAENDVQEIISQVVQGLCFMHEEGFAHRDLKPGNVLIKSMPPAENWWVKICDLGLSKRIEDVVGSTTTVKGTPGFLAPELYGFGGGNPRMADPYPVDIWCLGEMTFRMSGGTAFPSETLQSVGASDSLMTFILRTMAIEPSSRLTARQASDNPWLNMMKQDVNVIPQLQISSDSAHRDPRLYHQGYAQYVASEPSGQWSTVTDLQGVNRMSSPQQSNNHDTHLEPRRDPPLSRQDQPQHVDLSTVEDLQGYSGPLRRAAVQRFAARYDTYEPRYRETVLDEREYLPRTSRKPPTVKVEVVNNSSSSSNDKGHRRHGSKTSISRDGGSSSDGGALLAGSSSDEERKRQQRASVAAAAPLDYKAEIDRQLRVQAEIAKYNKIIASRPPPTPRYRGGELN
ncbi:kinase-like domain-containing protein [Xylariaceae sp. FL0804]|nr:kinase-like domain-containing protein [Xylariaceae sp. FL0804]